jgi:putative glutamine amidotransferase
MSQADPIKPRIGIPWRTSQEEAQHKTEKLRNYFDRVIESGGEPIAISLSLTPDALQKQLEDLDAFVLPGSPADVDPARYGAQRDPKTLTVDPPRDQTDLAVLAHAQQSEKPVLAICYGCQILNVFFRGSLIQDILTANPQSLQHGKTDLPAGKQTGDLEHSAQFESDSRLARLAGATSGKINSSHHQAIGEPGNGLRVTARAADGTIEAVELQSSRDWVVGVQWHPERMPDDPLAQKLFKDFIAAARSHNAVPSGR